VRAHRPKLDGVGVGGGGREGIDAAPYQRPAELMGAGHLCTAFGFLCGAVCVRGRRSHTPGSLSTVITYCFFLIQRFLWSTYFFIKYNING
jgi:hypothetical protein